MIANFRLHSVKVAVTNFGNIDFKKYYNDLKKSDFSLSL